MPLGEDPAGGPQEERDNLNALTARATRAQIRALPRKLPSAEWEGSGDAAAEPGTQFAGVEQAACQRVGEMEASELKSEPFIAP